MRRFCQSLPFFMAGGILLGNCAFRSAAGESKVSEKAVPAESEEMKRSIDQLGSDRFKDREQATQELSKLGKSALPSLKEAAKSRDPEVRRRAQQLIERMEAPPVRSIGPRLEQRLPAMWFG
jgi:vacuolar-type H+-ATPase subunit H